MESHQKAIQEKNRIFFKKKVEQNKYNVFDEQIEKAYLISRFLNKFELDMVSAFALEFTNTFKGIKSISNSAAIFYHSGLLLETKVGYAFLHILPRKNVVLENITDSISLKKGIDDYFVIDETDWAFNFLSKKVQKNIEKNITPNEVYNMVKHRKYRNVKKFSCHDFTIEACKTLDIDTPEYTRKNNGQLLFEKNWGGRGTRVWSNMVDIVTLYTAFTSIHKSYFYMIKDVKRVPKRYRPKLKKSIINNIMSNHITIE